MERFLELLAQLDEDIAALSDAELTEARDEIAAYGRELRESAADVEDQTALLADATALAAALSTIDTELETRTEAATAAEAARDEAFASFGESETPADDVEEPASEAVEDEPAEEPVVAAAPALADIARRRPRTAPAPDPVEPAAAVIAAAVGEQGQGARFDDRDALARAMFDANRRGPANGSQTVARMQLDSRYEMTASPEDNWALLDGMQRDVQKALQAGESLVAAGFCAPAEPVYDFFQQGSRDGILQLPVVNARRGRLQYPAIWNIRDLQVQAGIAWEHTATMDEDAVEKPCYTVACADGVTFDVNGYSTCLTYSNFDSQFYPERVSHITGQSMIAHDHEVNLAIINAIVADGRTLTVVDGHTNGGTWVQLSQSLALHAGFVRNRFRLPLSTVLEAGIPSFVLDALIADQVARDSTTEYGMAQAEIEAAIRRFGVNVQWLYDWQEPGHPNWPADYDYLLYPAGTVVKLSGGTLDMGVTRDSVLNVANDFQVFSETFDGHAIIGSGVYYVTGVDLCPNGETGQRAALACAAGS